MVQNHSVPLVVCSVDRAGVIEYLVYGVRRFSAVEVDRVFACFDQQIQNAHEFDAEIIYSKNKSIKIYHCLINGCASFHFLSLNLRFLVCNWGCSVSELRKNFFTKKLFSKNTLFYLKHVRSGYLLQNYTRHTQSQAQYCV